jgi:hypothetical protein
MGLRGPGARPNRKADVNPNPGGRKGMYTSAERRGKRLALENPQPKKPKRKSKPKPRYQGVGSKEAITKLKCKRLRQERQNAGLEVLKVETHYYKFIAHLLQATKDLAVHGLPGFITEDEALDKTKVEAVASRVLDNFNLEWPLGEQYAEWLLDVSTP